MDLSITSETFGVDDQTWIGAAHGIDLARSITLDVSAFTEGTHYPDGYFKPGLPLGRITGTGLYGPYGGSASEVQSFNLGAASAGTFTLSFDGETSAAIAFNASAATLKAALEAMANINPGDVSVSGGPLPAAVTITFGGQYQGVNVPQLTIDGASTTGETITITTDTAGGSSASDGTENLSGFLLTPVKAPAVNTTDVGAALYEHGRVVEANLPIAIDAAGKADVAGRITFE